MTTPRATAESLHKTEKRGADSDKPQARTPSDPEDEHLGATEDQVSETPAPAGAAFKDEPKQG